MQVESIGNDDVQAGKAIKRAMTLLAAVAIAAAAGLATIGLPEADLTPDDLTTDTNEYGVPTSSTTEAPAAPATVQPDPEFPAHGSRQRQSRPSPEAP